MAGLSLDPMKNRLPRSGLGEFGCGEQILIEDRLQNHAAGAIAMERSPSCEISIWRLECFQACFCTSWSSVGMKNSRARMSVPASTIRSGLNKSTRRSEEHTSE